MLFQFDRDLMDNGILAGMDEAGRGPLAGPVVCALVVMPLGEGDVIAGVNDSKKLSSKQRDTLYELIVNKALAYSIAVVSEDVIDDINILQATRRGMEQCISHCAIRPDMVLVDAVKALNTDVPYMSIIKGDAKSYSIACASILAKVTRDRLMMDYAKLYPEYEFGRHKGYGTALHIEKLKMHGPCKIHRNSFIKNFGLSKKIDNISNNFSIKVLTK